MDGDPLFTQAGGAFRGFYHTMHGRVTTLLADGTIEKQAGRIVSEQTSHVMLCGNSAMIKDMRALLEARGLHRHTSRKPGHYTTEIYH